MSENSPKWQTVTIDIRLPFFYKKVIQKDSEECYQEYGKVEKGQFVAIGKKTRTITNLVEYTIGKTEIRSLQEIADIFNSSCLYPCKKISEKEFIQAKEEASAFLLGLGTTNE